jgi:hypothetical protein
VTGGLIAAALLPALSAASTGAATPVTPSTAVGSPFTAVSPVRVLDTRNGTGGVSGPIGPNSTAVLDLSGRLPASATAAVLNVTGTEPTANTYVTVFPHGSSLPTASNLNLVAGQTRPNLVTVAVGADRRVDLYNHVGTVHLVADLTGYYASDSRSKYTQLSPSRVHDTRWYSDIGPTGPNGVTTINLQHRVPASATAVIFNLTVTEPTAATYVTAFPHGSARPVASNANVTAGETVANLVTIALGTNQQVDLYNHAGYAHLIVDLAGFYTPDYGAVYTAVPPVRVLDTRDGTGTWSGLPGPVGAGGNLAVRPGAQVPDSAIAAVLNLTGTAATATTWAAAWQNRDSRPSVSNLNLLPGQTVPNLAAVELTGDPQGTRFYLYNHTGTVHLIGDLAGYFTVQSGELSNSIVYSYTTVPVDVLGLSGVSAIAGGSGGVGMAIVPSPAGSG